MSGRITLVLLAVWMCAFAVQAQIQHPTAWLRADSAVLNAPSWVDVSGNGYNAMPSSGAMPATFSRMNFNKCFEVGSAVTFTLPLGINDSRQSDVIVVYETIDTVHENALWQIRIDSTSRIGQTTQRILNENGQITYDTANRLRPVVNYLAQSWRTPEVCTPTLAFCMADSLRMNGKIAEVIYFDSRISDTSVIQWISYLAIKYGITLTQTDYLDSRKKIIWNNRDYSEFSSSIAGLGRDNSMGLCQKQSYFADEQIVIGIDNFATTNEANSAHITNGHFIVMGMDINGLQNATEVYTQNGELYQVIGKSIVQGTGAISTYNTFLLLDTSVVNDSITPALLIDRSGSGNFPIGETMVIWPSTNDSLGYFVYENISWDLDNSGTDLFCFAINMLNEEIVEKSHLGTKNDTKIDLDLQQKNLNQASLFQQSENLKTADYRLFPNPNRGRFIVEITYPIEQDVTLKVYTSDGKMILVKEGKGKSRYCFEGNVETPGHYLIEIVSNWEKKSMKMVVH